MYLCLKKLDDEVGDAPNKSLQRGMRLEVRGDHRPYLAILSCWNNTIIGRLNEFGYKKLWSTWIHNILSPSHNREGLLIVKLLLDR